MNLRLETNQLIALNKTSVMERIQTSLLLNNYKVIAATESTISFKEDINSFKLVANLTTIVL